MTFFDDIRVYYNYTNDGYSGICEEFGCGVENADSLHDLEKLMLPLIKQGVSKREVESRSEFCYSSSRLRAEYLEKYKDIIREHIVFSPEMGD